MSMFETPPLLEFSEQKDTEKERGNEVVEIKVTSKANKECNSSFEEVAKDRSAIPLSGTERYKCLDEFLGEGTYGRVEKAIDTLTKKIVAIKKVKVNTMSSSNSLTDKKGKDNMLNNNVGNLGVHFTVVRELRVMREIIHENIMSALDLYIERDFICLVMEVMSTDLKKVIARKIRLSEAHIKCLLQQILRGLQALHSMYILHRDLSPANVFINNEGVCRIADFGLARSYATYVHTSHTQPQNSISQSKKTDEKRRAADSDLNASPLKDTSIHGNSGSKFEDEKNLKKQRMSTGTVTDVKGNCCDNDDITSVPVDKSSAQSSKASESGMPHGTFICSNKDLMTSKVVTLWYRSPELLFGAVRYGPAVDIWSIGCILAELLSGKPIFPGANEVDQLVKIFSIRGSPKQKLQEGTSSNAPDIIPEHAPANFWPDVTSLQCYFGFTNCEPRELKSLFPNCSLECLDLLERLLFLDPKRRPNAEQALNHKWFHTQPLPSPRSQLPFSPLYK